MRYFRDCWVWLQPEALENVENVEYPDNLTIKNIAYFILAPTLCYQVYHLTLKQVKMGFRLESIIGFVYAM